MRPATLLALAASVCSVTAKLSPNRFLKRNDHAILNARDNQAAAATTTVSYGSYSKPSIIPQNKNTTKFKVDGTKIPDVDFDIGESYAGLLPISDKPNVSELFFWFFPSENPKASDGMFVQGLLT
jgi:carboxypeptidase D